ncbi:glycosyltransferase, partial [bacterium]
RCGNSPLRVVSENIQLPRAAAANAGLQAVKGEFFCFLDEDDLLFPNHFDELYKVLIQSESLAVYSSIKRVNAKNELLNVYDSEFNFQELLWSNFIPLHALLFRTEPIRDNCLFEEKLEIFEDWDFLIQVGLLGNVTHLHKVTGIYRDSYSSGVQHDEDKIQKYRMQVFEKWKYKLSEEHYIGFLNYLSALNLPEKKYYEKKYAEEHHKLQDTQNIIKAIQNSLSWKITAPLRKISRILRK